MNVNYKIKNEIEIVFRRINNEKLLQIDCDVKNKTNEYYSYNDKKK